MGLTSGTVILGLFWPRKKLGYNKRTLQLLQVVGTICLYHINMSKAFVTGRMDGWRGRSVLGQVCMTITTLSFACVYRGNCDS